MTASSRRLTDVRSGLIALIVLLVAGVLGFVWLGPLRAPLPEQAADRSPRATSPGPAPSAPAPPPAAHPIAIIPEPHSPHEPHEPQAELGVASDP